jgi:hypothetical protein
MRGLTLRDDEPAPGQGRFDGRWQDVDLYAERDGAIDRHRCVHQDHVRRQRLAQQIRHQRQAAGEISQPLSAPHTGADKR